MKAAINASGTKMRNFAITFSGAVALALLVSACVGPAYYDNGYYYAGADYKSVRNRASSSFRKSIIANQNARFQFRTRILSDTLPDKVFGMDT
jgi:hypothetical protein